MEDRDQTLEKKIKTTDEVEVEGHLAEGGDQTIEKKLRATEDDEPDVEAHRKPR